MLQTLLPQTTKEQQQHTVHITHGMGTDDSPAQPALVPASSKESDVGHDNDGDALRVDPAEASADSINKSTTAAAASRSSSTSSLSSSNSASTAAAASPCDPLAAVTAVKPIPMPVHEHPLSPDISLATASRTSYFRSSVLNSSISPVSNVIFPEEDEDDNGTPDVNDINKQGDAQMPPQAEGSLLVASPSNIDKTPSATNVALPTILRLPQPPHRLSPEVVDQRLREVSTSDLRGIELAQELSSQLETLRKQLTEFKKLQHAREQGLISLLRETGSVSESLISRTLVRANVEAAEALKSEETDTHGWKVSFGGVRPLHQATKPLQPTRVCARPVHTCSVRSWLTALIIVYVHSRPSTRIYKMQCPRTTSERRQGASLLRSLSVSKARPVLFRGVPRQLRHWLRQVCMNAEGGSLVNHYQLDFLVASHLPRPPTFHLRQTHSSLACSHHFRLRQMQAPQASLMPLPM